MIRCIKLHRLFGCTSGAAAIEFAMVGLILICLLLGIFEFGRALFLRNQLAFAADIATRQVLLNAPETSSDLENLEAAIRNSIPYDQGGLQVELTLPSEEGIMPITLRQPLRLLVPDLLLKNITLSVSRQIPLP
nr:TadE/TadG family type IV pilus assembly protein [Paracoccus saliphilus]